MRTRARLRRARRDGETTCTTATSSPPRPIHNRRHRALRLHARGARGRLRPRALSRPRERLARAPSAASRGTSALRIDPEHFPPKWLPVRRRKCDQPQASAITAIEIFIPFGRIGSFAPWRAGGSTANHLFHSSFMPAKSLSSPRMKVALTALSSALKAVRGGSRGRSTSDCLGSAMTPRPSRPTLTSKSMFGYQRRYQATGRSARSTRLAVRRSDRREPAFIDRLAAEGAVTDYLLRLRRVDNSPVWVEVTAHADASGVRWIGAHRRARPRRQRAQETRRRNAGYLSPVAAGREDGRARPNHFRRRARAEQSPGDDSQMGRAIVAAAARGDRREDRTRARNDPRANRSARRVSSATCSRSRASVKRRARWSISTTLSAKPSPLRAYEQRITNITVVDALAAGLPQVFADAHQIQQVLLNLVINAEQAMLSAIGRGILVVRTWHDAARDAGDPRDQR